MCFETRIAGWKRTLYFVVKFSLLTLAADSPDEEVRKEITRVLSIGKTHKDGQLSTFASLALSV